MHHRICGISPYGLSDLSEGDMHAACIVYIPRCSTAFFTYFNAQCISRIFVLSTFHCVVWHPYLMLLSLLISYAKEAGFCDPACSGIWWTALQNCVPE